MLGCNNIAKNNQSNEIVTSFSNSYQHLPPTLKKFLDECTRINTEQGPFCFKEFCPPLSQVNFRQRINRIKDFVEIAIPGFPTFYKVKGVPQVGDWRKVTPKPMGAAKNLIETLESLKDQPAMIHDVRLRINLSIHEELVERGYIPDKHNSSILVNVPVLDPNITIKSIVFTNHIQIAVACTYKPIVIDICTLMYFFEILSQAAMCLFVISGKQILPVKDWIFTHYHFNKDGKYGLDGSDFHYTVGEVTTGMIRFYSKCLPDGTKIARLEQVKRPNQSVYEAMVEAVERNF